MTVAPFVYADWATEFPELASVDSATATRYFSRAQLYLDNTDCSPVPCDPSTYAPRQELLYLLTAHIAKLSSSINGSTAAGLVGRIANATQGSVSVAAEMPGAPGSAAWFNQTTYGAEYWAATMSYRSAIYVADIYGPFEGFGGVPYYWGRG